MAAAKWEIPSGGPQMSSADWVAFAETHFSPDAVASFGHTFQNPAGFQQTVQEPERDDWGEEDDLGYYEDGVKRTLTDEQIEMFRQSELRELRRLQAKRPTPQSAAPEGGLSNDDKQSPSHRREATPQREPRGTTRKKNKKKNGVKKPRYEPKPDLRKRTWDVVDQGLDTLDYD